MSILKLTYHFSSNRVNIFSQLYNKYLIFKEPRKYMMLDIKDKLSAEDESNLLIFGGRSFYYTEGIRKSRDLLTITLDLTPYMRVIAYVNRNNKIYLELKENIKGYSILMSSYFKDDEFKMELFRTILDIVKENNIFNKTYNIIQIEDHLNLYVGSKGNGKYLFFNCYNTSELLHKCLVYYNKYSNSKNFKLETLNSRLN